MNEKTVDNKSTVRKDFCGWKNGKCTVSSDRDYTLEIDGVPHQIHAGTQGIVL